MSANQLGSSVFHRQCVISRRAFLTHAGCGFGGLTFAWLMYQDTVAADSKEKKKQDPLAARPTILEAKAKNVIWCFMDGGPSHLDLFDPKPTLHRLHGHPLPDSFVRPVTSRGVTAYSPLLSSKCRFKQHGASGVWVSDLYPEIASCVDDIAVIRSCQSEAINHVSAVHMMNCLSGRGGRPSMGAWTVYGLGTENSNLPAFVILSDYPEAPPGGSRNWSTGFLPSVYQGTRFRGNEQPIPNLVQPDGMASEQRRKLDLLRVWNRHHCDLRVENDQLEARIAAYELAYRMQAKAPEAIDLSRETEETKRLYGCDQAVTCTNGTNCLLARRLVERGVRFVQLYFGSGSRWDAHKDLDANHRRYCRESDRPIAGLLKDLKRRSLLDHTLVVWGGEFGRTPMSEGASGRDHNPFGFTMWMAGGGIRGGVTYGATDDIGLYAVENVARVQDVHATILRCLGIDHRRLTYRHDGRRERPTIDDVGMDGQVLWDILA